MDLEKLRILIEASTGDSATQVGRLNKVLEQHAGALKLAERAAQAAERAEKLHAAGVSQASAAVLKAAREQQQATNARISAGKTVLATMNRAAQAEARAVINRKGLNKALAETIAMSARADAVFAKVNRALAQGATTAQGAAKGQKSIGDAFFGAMQKAFFFMSAVDRVRGALTKLYGAAENAARTNTAKMYFEEAGKSLERLRAVSKGMISDADLLKKSNLADSMGLSSGVFENLIRVAQAASAKTGQSFDHMFDSIVLGTARSSRLLLDNLGIIVNVKEANRAYAREAIKNGEAHGKTVQQVVESMTAEAKQAAFLQAMYKATAGQLKELDKIGQGGAGTFDRWAAAVDNLKLQLTTQLLPAIERVLRGLTQIVDQMAYSAKASAFADKWQFGEKPIPGLGAVPFSAEEGGSPDTEAFYQNAIGAFNDLEADLLLASNGLLSLDNAVDPATYEVTAFAQALLEGSSGLSELPGLVTRLAQAARALEIRGTSTKPPPKIPLLDEGGGGGGGPSEKPVDLAALSEQAHMTRIINEAKAIEERNEALDRHEADYLAALRKEDEIRQEFLQKEAEAADAYNVAKAQLQLEELQAQRDRLDDYKNQAAGVINGVGQAVSGETGQFVSVISTAIGALFGAPQIGEAVGGLLEPFVGNMPGLTDVVMGLYNGMILLVQHGIGPLMAALAPLGESLQNNLTAWGLLLGNLLQVVVIGLTLAVPVLGFLIDMVTALVIVLGAVVSVVEAVLTGLNIFAVLLNLFTGFSTGSDALVAFAYWADRAGETMILGAMKFNNVIVDFVRWLGDLLSNDALKEWGKKLHWEDFELPEAPDDPTPDNTEAVMENTRAVRDLAREFHNLPSGYKGNAAVYAATDPREPRFRQPFAGRDLSGLQQGPASRLFNPYRG